MSNLVTRTKVILPQRRKELLTRQRLILKLYELLDYRLILVIAPAGYGKTSLLVDFARQVEMPVCWLSLDELDLDPSRFLAHFISALESRFPQFGRQSTTALVAAAQPGFDLDRLVAAVVNDAYEHIQEHFLLILDDYHLVQNQPEIQQFINQFIINVAENCHLVLASRSLLTLPDMPLLVARSQVGGIGYEDLAFQPEEIQSLVMQNYRVALPTKTAANLANHTEGWITGLLLTTQSMWQGLAAQLQKARISDIGLYDYLAQQVLDQQPPPLRDFLLRSAYLEEFDADLCSAAFGDSEDWNALIAAVLQHNLFVIPVGEAGQWLRYHHLFRDFLQSTFEREHAEELPSLLQAIASGYETRQEWEKAFAAYQRLGHTEQTASLIEKAGLHLIRSERSKTLLSWIESLPAELVASRPILLSHKGTAWMNLGQVENSLKLLNQAEAGLSAAGDQANLAITLARRITALRLLGKYREALKDGETVLSLTQQHESPLAPRAEALRSLGVSLYHLGRLQEAMARLSQALVEFSLLGDHQNAALVHMELGLCLRTAGQYGQALEHYEKALSYWRQVQNTTRMAFVLNNLGVLRHLTGDYLQANKLFKEALAYAQQNGMERVEAYLLLSIGDLYRELEANEAAADNYRRAREISLRINDHQLYFYCRLTEAIQARHSKQFNKAQELMQQAGEISAENGSDFEQGLWHTEAGLECLQMGQPEQAIAHLSKATEYLDKGGQTIDAARAYLYLANAYYAAGQHPSARQALQRTFDLVSGAESQHFLAVAGRECVEMLHYFSAQPETGPITASLLDQVRLFESSIPSLRRSIRPQALSVLFAPPKLIIRAFGKNQVLVNGNPVTSNEWLNQRRARELFFYLLTHPEGLSKERIGIVLWPESSTEQLKIQFKNALYRLRLSLGSDVVLYDGNVYSFNRALDYEYDVETFEKKIETAQKSRQLEEQVENYRAAVELYADPYLPDLDASWIDLERQRLFQLYIQAALNLVRLRLENGSLEAALKLCQKVISEDVCNEEAYRLAMQIHAAMGNQAAVVRQFEECRKALLSQIGIEPSNQTVLLYQRLVR